MFKDVYTGKNYAGNKRLDEILLHCGGASTDGTEIGQYLSGFDVPIEDKAMVLWGTVWEVTCHYYYKNVKDHDRKTTNKEEILSIINVICL